jgi:Dihydroorotase and related cyclic amidohydrolases
LRQAREEGYSFQADVNLANLLLSDRALEGYDTLYKVYPPLREEADRQALSEAVKEGLITCITSDHQPWSVEDKRCEFEQATFGAASLETFFGALWCEFQGAWDLGMLIDRISHGPRQALGIPTRKIAEGETAELTLFDPNRSWSLSAAELESKAANCLFLDRELRGKPLGIINKGMALFLE